MWNRSAKINKLIRMQGEEEIEAAALTAQWIPDPGRILFGLQPLALATLAMSWLNLLLLVSGFLAVRTCSAECCRK